MHLETCYVLSDEGPTLEMLDFTIRIGSTPTFLYFDLYNHTVHCLADSEGPKISFPIDQPKTTKQNPTFTWTSSEPAKFKCGLDNSFNLVDCDQGTSGQRTFKDIPDGHHLFLVYGVDEMNNRGPFAQHDFTVGEYH